MNFPTKTTVILALDIGTSSTRALLFDEAGHTVGAIAQRPYQNTTTPDGGVETDADALLQLTLDCIDERLSHADAPHEIAGVAMSCFWHSLLAVDASNQALTPVFSWADNRAAPWVQPLRALLDEEQTHARTGCVFHPSYWPAKLLWLQATRPALFAASTCSDGQTPAVRWMSFGEYVALHLNGTARVSLSMASGTGLFNQNALDWDETVLGAMPIRAAQLSPLCDCHDALPPLQSEVIARWPQLKNAKWFPAVGDGAASNIGSGGVDAQTIVMNCGTSGALRIVLEDWTAPPPRGLWRYRIDRRRSVVGGALSNAGNVLLWARQNLQLGDDWNAQLAQSGNDHGLTVLPFLAGERSPLWNAHARFCISGGTLDTTPIELLRASLQGASLRFKVLAEALKIAMQNAALPPAKAIVFSGGALDASPAWAQMMCDCLGAPLVESREKEASARGAALLALESLGAINDVTDLPAQRGEALTPNESHRDFYARALERQNNFYEQLHGAE